MRFIGNKEKIIDNIYQIIKDKNIKGSSFFDVFSGTSNVGKFFKQLDYQIFSSDVLYFSYVLQMAYLVNNKKPNFKKLLKSLKLKSTDKKPLELVVEYLNSIKPKKGFIYKNYTPEGSSKLEQPRMYFSNENGKIIDAIRMEIEKWKEDKLIENSEYYILLACLIETVPFYSNITGVYGAFQKKWDARALKKLKLRTIQLIYNSKNNFSFNTNSLDLIEKVEADIFYLDPPYNQRQYAPNYHILETIAKYDNPEIKGVTGLRNYDNQKSNFCNPKKGIIELSEMAEKAKCSTFILSYNSEGIMKKDDILKTLKKYGKVELVEFEHRRYKSNNNGNLKDKKHILEQVYILNK
uniref:DNA adenine methylase n=1 Tax=Candidatus Thiodubiliella endoseptemdiera TaxID=2738886 RepID=UPI0034DF7E2E